MSVKTACAVEGFVVDDGWTLSGWQDEPSVPESARVASAKLSKYKPATKPDPPPGQLSSRQVLSGSSSSRSVASAGSQRSTSSLSTPSTAADKRRPRVKHSPQGTLGNAAATSAQLNAGLVRQGVRHLRQQQHKLTGSCGEEDDAGDAAAGEHYRPPTGEAAVAAAVTSRDTLTAEVSTAATVAADSCNAGFTLVPHSTQCRDGTKQPCQHLQLSSGNEKNSNGVSELQVVQQQEDQQQQQQTAGGDALMQGLLSRLACSPISSSTTSSSGKALRPTISFHNGKASPSTTAQLGLSTAASDPARMCSSDLLLPATKPQQHQQGYNSSSGSSRSGSASSAVGSCDNTTRSSEQVALPSPKEQQLQQQQQPSQQQSHDLSTTAMWSPVPRGSLHLGSTVRRCHSLIGAAVDAAAGDEGHAAAAAYVEQSQQQQVAEVSTSSSNQLQSTSSSQNNSIEARSAHINSAYRMSRAARHTAITFADSQTLQAPNGRNNTICGNDFVVSGSLGNASIVAGSSSSSLGLQSNQLQTPGLAAKAQMQLTKHLAAAASQTPRTRLMQAAATRRYPAPAAASSGSFGLGVLTAAAGASAVGLSITSGSIGLRRTASSSCNHCGSRPSSAAMIEASSPNIKGKAVADTNTYVAQNSRAWGRFASSSAACAASGSSSSKVCRPHSCGNSRPSSAGVISSGTISSFTAAVGGQRVCQHQLSVEELLQTTSKHRQPASGSSSSSSSVRRDFDAQMSDGLSSRPAQCNKGHIAGVDSRSRKAATAAAVVAPAADLAQLELTGHNAAARV